ncbi:PREDICTED: pentatricopeptide repeat-containing protein At2g27610-like [Nelumbo nucifera]|uniref:Pentatricopeptide repeat-containing protein At2g27610-like n=2 Tax=Nelumbo nucifera TaxID=4432 RepID=A0A1U8Q3V6_NELNU|nr:PREDICTED: pentatricopeptide repeat-containing protein At2g27610-like [Nelumbo nucifera]XP_010252917.1 PREDICTED: pentatricopeptide repeat-containing protein At2g27610-like [Nelumbo nucifera]XP_019052720.1 PREDICTED: pentatricopeptide repeat-containing protein At2g27610-like [Nelumbo nucifera]DAD23766.1 TPA_asm: hypothetical protein HUJ06_025229 [Nelumbo nucifera]
MENSSFGIPKPTVDFHHSIQSLHQLPCSLLTWRKIMKSVSSISLPLLTGKPIAKHRSFTKMEFSPTKNNNGMKSRASLLDGFMDSHYESIPMFLAQQKILWEFIESRSLDEARYLHTKMKEEGLEPGIVTESILIDLFMKSARVSDAFKVFEAMLERNVVTWTSIISGCVQNGFPEIGISMFVEMLELGVLPNDFTLNVVLQACADLAAANLGMQVHSLVIRAGFVHGCRTENFLINLYSKCCLIDMAHRVFDRMLKPDLVSFTSMIGGYSKNKMSEAAIRLFDRMLKCGLVPNDHTISSILVACGFIFGEQIHAFMVKTLLDKSLHSGSALIEFYSKNDSFENAKLVFEKLEDRNVVTWTSMISCCIQHERGDEALDLFHQMVNLGIEPNVVTFATVIAACGLCSEFTDMGQQIHCSIIKLNLGSDNRIVNALITMYARNKKIEELEKVFEKIENPDRVSWSAAISGYSQNGFNEKAACLLCQMHKKGARPNEYGISSTLSSCANLALLDQGKQLHGFCLKLGYDIIDVCVGNALVSMYAKCGSVEDAQLAFDGMPFRDVMSWNTLIHGYAYHGHGGKALQIFDEMVASETIRPNHATFVGILSACSHVGYVEEAFDYFKIMESHHGIVPSMSHYACLVDLIGRAGRLEEAYQIIEQMPFEPNSLIWKTLLGSCRVHKNLKLGKLAAQRAIELSPCDSANYILLSNLYTVCGERVGSEMMRKMMEEKGVKKDAGFSWIELKSEVHAFVSGDKSHPKTQVIYNELDKLVRKMKEEGYSPDLSCALYDS